MLPVRFRLLMLTWAMSVSYSSFFAALGHTNSTFYYTVQIANIIFCGISVLVSIGLALVALRRVAA